MPTVEQVNMLLYRTRPDLWAVSRVLVHCKGSNLARYCWDSMNDTDKQTLSEVSDGRVPTAFEGE